MHACFLTICGLCECRCVPRSDSQADWDCNIVTYEKISLNFKIVIVCFIRYDSDNRV